ncbi:MAG: YicC family protein [Chromatiales bacterium]|nr:YicC family protein [Chromatiales bacterium]
MIRSMTGFGRAEGSGTWGTVTWEVRTVNHRYLEVSLRLPEALRELDTEVRARMRDALGRGKVDAQLRLDLTVAEAPDLRINSALADALIAVARDLSTRLGTALPGVDTVLRWPGVVDVVAPDAEVLAAVALETLDAALGQLDAARASEGERLAQFLRQRLEGLREQTALARARRPLMLESRRTRLAERLAELRTEVDPARLERELVLFAQPVDVDEEIDRLGAHLDEIDGLVNSKQPVGRRLDFLVQELNREANTLGSKANDLETTRAAVEMKVLIEQMREQVQNIE